jgi:N-acetylglucosamine-6-phosphate deacetylase
MTDRRLDNLSALLVEAPYTPYTLQISPRGLWRAGPPHKRVRLKPGALAYAPDPQLRIIPGLIDIHVHGGMGLTFGEHPDRLEEELRAYSAWVAASGVTGFLCSIAAATPRELLALVRAYAAILPRELPGAACLGLHLEGPFLSEARRGAFQAAWLRYPSVTELQELLETGRGWIRQITLAPELPGALEIASLMRADGLAAAVGHTDGDYATISAALQSSFNHVTHTFNAMSPFSHFTPGAVGAVLTSAEISAELIADGVHVHPGAMRLLFRCLGAERVVLVTDAMAGAGMPDGTYELIGSPVVVKDGQARRPEDGRLAGSTATLNRCVANMIRLGGASFPQAVQMASLNPARVIGCDRQCGTLAAGKEASFALVDQELRVYQTVVKGRVVYDTLS